MSLLVAGSCVAAHHPVKAKANADHPSPSTQVCRLPDTRFHATPAIRILIEHVTQPPHDARVITGAERHTSNSNTGRCVIKTDIRSWAYTSFAICVVVSVEGSCPSSPIRAARMDWTRRVISSFVCLAQLLYILSCWESSFLSVWPDARSWMCGAAAITTTQRAQPIVR